MANVLNEEKQQQILALGRLGWSLRRIQQATRVRRETISGYLKAAGIAVWRPGGWSRQGQAKPAMQVITDPAKPAIEVTTGSMSEMPALNPNLNRENLPHKRKSNSEDAKPAIEVITGFGGELRGREAANPSSSRSACELFEQAIQLGLSRGRNARAIWQDLVSDHGFSAGYQSVRRYIYRLRGSQTPQALAVILTSPGEEAQVDNGSGPMVRDPQSGKYRRSAPALASGPNYTRKHFNVSEELLGSSFWITCARACCWPTSTIPLSIPSIAMCWSIMAPWPCPVAFRIPIAKAKWNPQ